MIAILGGVAGWFLRPIPPPPEPIIKFRETRYASEETADDLIEKGRQLERAESKESELNMLYRMGALEIINNAPDEPKQYILRDDLQRLLHDHPVEELKPKKK